MKAIERKPTDDAAELLQIADWLDPSKDPMPPGESWVSVTARLRRIATGQRPEASSQETLAQIAARLVDEGRAPSEAVIAYSLASVALSFEQLLKEMDQSKCGHGVVTLFGACQDCERMNH